MMPSEAIWCVFSCIYRNGTFGAIANWGTRTPRDTGVFTIDHLQDKLRTLQVAMVPSKKTGSPWHPHGLMRFFPFIVEKMERLWDIFFWKVNKSENPPFFSKKTHGFLRLLHIHEAATVKPWKNDFKVHRFQCWRVGGLKPNRERPFKPLYILY